MRTAVYPDAAKHRQPSSHTSKPPRISVAQRMAEDAHAAGCIIILLQTDGGMEAAWWAETTAIRHEAEKIARGIVR